MAFVNAFTTPEDIEKYGLDLFDKRFHLDAVDASQWTVDRERGLYLRIATIGGEEGQRQSRWTFLWHKDLLFLVFEALEPGNDRGLPHYRLRHLDLPFHLRRYRQDIADAIDEALAVYRHGGVHSQIASFSVALEPPAPSSSDFGGLYLMGC
jgi:hypothetical protein